jgi:[acyl-carrier-protein] S-malonyltransferase
VLVSKAVAMQKACEKTASTMAAILGLDDKIVEEVCAAITEVVVPANYNSPGQIVISGSNEGINLAIEALRAKGAKRTLKLAVGGAFHSPLMEPARQNWRRLYARQILVNRFVPFTRMLLHCRPLIPIL